MRVRAVFVVVASLGMLVAFGQVQAGISKKAEAKSDLKQIAVGMLMYANDSDDILPYPRENRAVFAAIAPYVRKLDVFRSPNPGSRFMFNMALGGVNLSTVKEPAKTIFIYDLKAWPDGDHLAALVDGHVNGFSGKAWKAAEKTLHAHFKRSANPLPAHYLENAYPKLKLGGQ